PHRPITRVAHHVAAAHPLVPFTLPPHTDPIALSLHDALPISLHRQRVRPRLRQRERVHVPVDTHGKEDVSQRPIESAVWCIGKSDRKSTRLNFSHRTVSYAVI